MGGLYDVVLVVGAEQQKTMSSLDGADVLGAAADYHNEKPEYGDYMFPKLFGRIAQIYIDNYGAKRSRPGNCCLEKLRAREIESPRPDARGRSHSQLRLAGLGQKSERRPTIEGFRLLADHRWLGWPRARVWKIFGKDRAR